MKDKLMQIFNTLRLIETKGDSTVLMADCLKSLVAVMQELESEVKDGEDIRK